MIGPGTSNGDIRSRRISAGVASANAPKQKTGGAVSAPAAAVESPVSRSISVSTGGIAATDSL